MQERGYVEIRQVRDLSPCSRTVDPWHATNKEVQVLFLTNRATKAVESVLAAPGLPDNVGVRITARRAARFRPSKLEATLEEAAPGDVVLERRGARVFVEDGASAYVVDKLLDAHIDDEHVRLTIMDRPIRPSWHRGSQRA
jgi:iron-sulfur cluster assembly protein